MTLLVYATENCMADARTHGLVTEVDRIRDRVEQSQSTSLFDPFPPPYLVKKKVGGRQGRLIADWRSVGDHAVVVFLAILIRGSRAYEDEFARDPTAYGRQHFIDLVSAGEIAAFVEERTRVPLPIEKQSPSETEFELLYGAFAHHTEAAPEDLVCETKQWVEQVNDERISKQLVLFCKPCLDALGRAHGLHFIAFHAGSELMADIEFNQVESFMRRHKSSLVTKLQRRRGPGGVGGFYWITVHSAIEAEHGEMALQALDLAFKYGPTELRSQFLDLVIEGFGSFVDLHKEFFDWASTPSGLRNS